jgi:hypothetical protein
MKRTEKSVSGSGFRDCLVSRVDSARPVVADRVHQDDDPFVGGAVASFFGSLRPLASVSGFSRASADAFGDRLSEFIRLAMDFNGRIRC